MSLPIQWRKPLPGSGVNVTSVLVNQIGYYAASNGWVYRLDPISGEVAASNEMKGHGQYEIRLAAPKDGSLLIAAINGYVVALDSVSLATRWQNPLPDSGQAVVSPLVGSGGVYAGSNGHVYKLDINNGAVVGQNNLPGHGSYETRLALSKDEVILYVGIDGQVVALPTSNLAVRPLWTNSLPGGGNGPTSVVSGPGVVYVGVKGKVFRIDEASGATKNTNSLPGAGDAEVRLAIDGVGTHLWVGTNGHAIGLQPDDISTIFDTPLPGSGSSITNVADGNQLAFFANNGIIFCLNVEGKVHYITSMALGRAEIRFSVHSTTEIVVGIEGQCASLTFPGFTASYGPWMKTMGPSIASKLLRQVALPGTHDSCTSYITSASRLGFDNPPIMHIIDQLAPAAAIQKIIMADWSRAQSLEVRRQLEAGIRYFDLRLQYADRPPRLEFTHGLVSGSLDGLIQQVTAYLGESQNNQEIVILDINHLYKFDSKAHQMAVAELQAFGALLAPADLGVDVTVQQLWNSSHRIIVLYDDDNTVSANPFLWPRSRIRSEWQNTADPLELFRKLDEEVARLPLPLFDVVQGVLTPDFGTILRGLASATIYPDSLRTLSNQANGMLANRLRNQWKGRIINIVICDWFNLAPNYVDAIVALNR